MAAYYRGRTEAFSTKIGLSIGAVTGCHYKQSRPVLASDETGKMRAQNVPKTKVEGLK